MKNPKVPESMYTNGYDAMEHFRANKMDDLPITPASDLWTEYILTVAEQALVIGLALTASDTGVRPVSYVHTTSATWFGNERTPGCQLVSST